MVNFFPVFAVFTFVVCCETVVGLELIGLSVVVLFDAILTVNADIIATKDMPIELNKLII